MTNACDHLWENRLSLCALNPLVLESDYGIHALSRNTKYWTISIDGQVCFYNRPFADAFEP